MGEAGAKGDHGFLHGNRSTSAFLTSCLAGKRHNCGLAVKYVATMAAAWLSLTFPGTQKTYLLYTSCTPAT
jgi:hypothetical protein